MNIIGLGSAGCNIAKEYSKFSQYKVFYMDCENNDYDNFINVAKQDTHQGYEENYTSSVLSKLQGETTLILCGSGKISGITLRLLEELKNCRLKILYIKSSEQDMSQAARLRDRLTSQVLQQYARSGVVEEVCIVSNQKVEEIIGEFSIKNYWQTINETIAGTLHMINVFSNIEPLLTNFTEAPSTARITTVGVVNFETGKENIFYDLSHPRNKLFYFGLNGDYIDQNKTLLQDVRNMIKQNSNENTNSSFSIYSTQYKEKYVYSVHKSSLIQEENLNL